MYMAKGNGPILHLRLRKPPDKIDANMEKKLNKTCFIVYYFRWIFWHLWWFTPYKLKALDRNSLPCTYPNILSSIAWMEKSGASTKGTPVVIRWYVCIFAAVGKKTDILYCWITVHNCTIEVHVKPKTYFFLKFLISGEGLEPLLNVSCYVR